MSAPFTCKYCGLPSFVDPSDQEEPATYCSEIDHGNVCDECGSTPVRDVLDGDKLCQECCDKWVRGEAT